MTETNVLIRLTRQQNHQSRFDIAQRRSIQMPVLEGCANCGARPGLESTASAPPVALAAAARSGKPHADPARGPRRKERICCFRKRFGIHAASIVADLDGQPVFRRILSDISISISPAPASRLFCAISRMCNARSSIGLPPPRIALPPSPVNARRNSASVASCISTYVAALATSLGSCASEAQRIEYSPLGANDARAIGSGVRCDTSMASSGSPGGMNPSWPMIPNPSLIDVRRDRQSVDIVDGGDDFCPGSALSRPRADAR